MDSCIQSVQVSDRSGEREPGCGSYLQSPQTQRAQLWVLFTESPITEGLGGGIFTESPGTENLGVGLIYRVPRHGEPGCGSYLQSPQAQRAWVWVLFTESSGTESPGVGLIYRVPRHREPGCGSYLQSPQAQRAWVWVLFTESPGTENLQWILPVYSPISLGPNGRSSVSMFLLIFCTGSHILSSVFLLPGKMSIISLIGALHWTQNMILLIKAYILKPILQKSMCV